MPEILLNVMTADNHVSRGSSLIGAARQNLPPGELGRNEPRGLRGRFGVSEKLDFEREVLNECIRY